PLITAFYGIDAWVMAAAQPWRDRFLQLFAEGDLFIVEGPAMRERMVDIGCPPEKVVIRRLGIDVKDTRFVRPDLGAGLKIAMVGRFVPKKGFVDGLRACLDAARTKIELQVTIVGDALGEGDASGQGIKRDLVTLAESPPLRGRVSFTGFLSPAEVRATVADQNVILR